MAEDRECQLRRRRGSGNPSLPLNLDVGYQIDEGCASQCTPSPSQCPSSRRTSAAAILEFKNKQQSFDIQVEDCDEEEITVDSDDEGDDVSVAGVDRPVTPTPIQDFGASIVYTEGPQVMDFLKVKALEHDCYTDVSDAESDDEEGN
ncbi:uncharacterized protein LOC113518037 [Galleria mellonella]|uniref:Uncharacterized protein LOC113518037 n=1 Tax=Galleria mellonella TaxID=7137 RepID=A0A6J1WSB2_GALME|nr:uncharacterized protein LOC113518037 [Galleria mellonella]